MERYLVQVALFLAAGVILLEFFGPLLLILGPMVMVFLWFPARVDPASWNPPPSAVAYVTATVDGEHSGPIDLDVCDAAVTWEVCLFPPPAELRVLGDRVWYDQTQDGIQNIKI